MVSILLFLISLSLFGYLFIFRQTNSSETLAENKPDKKVVTEPVEEFVYNNIQGLESIQSAADDQREEIENKSENNTETKTETKKENPTKENNKNILPKAPPKLPEPIEAPLIETAQVTSTEEEKTNEEIKAPPPKEVIKESEEPTYFVAVEEMPEPIGGLTAIQQKIVYPELARRAGVQGKVYIRAFVDENGNVTSAEVVKGIGGGCDEAALDAILKTKFTPGKQRGKPIKVQVTVPVLFKL
ncbi:MAG: energy transducer TonB [bacterium]|nr:energy transducer TonB [bacterium]